MGGTNSPHNFITLCEDCHAFAHGRDLWVSEDITREDIFEEVGHLRTIFCAKWQNFWFRFIRVREYLLDFYSPCWNPWADEPYPCHKCPDRLYCQADGCRCPKENVELPYNHGGRLKVVPMAEAVFAISEPGSSNSKAALFPRVSPFEDMEEGGGGQAGAQDPQHGCQTDGAIKGDSIEYEGEAGR